ncbi:MAG: pirin family protein [Nitrososphaeraceae archaeon]
MICIITNPPFVQSLKSYRVKQLNMVKVLTLNRSFPNNFISEFDPFLLLNEMGAMDIKPRKQEGFHDHAHRGFETVTYLLSRKKI